MCFNLQEAEHGHDLTNGHPWHWLQEIKETWNVLLQIQFDLKRLERGPVVLPNVLEGSVCDLLELVDLAKEQVHIFYRLVEDRVLRRFWYKGKG